MEKKFLGISIESIAKTLIAAVTAGSMVLAGIGFMLDKKLEPINKYVSLQIVRNIQKQAYKIDTDPEDIKPDDLKHAIDDYGFFLSESYKSQSLQNEIAKINQALVQIRVK